MDNLEIAYTLKFQTGEPRQYRVQLDPQTFEYIDNPEQNLPEWSSLAFEQCSNCPLSAQETSHCPVAVNLVKLVDLCKDANSFDELELTVNTSERTTSSKTTAQKGICSLFGLIMAASPCPHTQFLKPMARYHLPLASGEETLYRAASMYLLAQCIKAKQGKHPDFELVGLTQMYKELQVVNMALANRIRTAMNNDSTVNAIILLDLFAKNIPDDISDSLVELHGLFQSYLREDN